jgi:hypothetical protein
MDALNDISSSQILIVVAVLWAAMWILSQWRNHAS